MSDILVTQLGKPADDLLSTLSEDERVALANEHRVRAAEHLQFASALDQRVPILLSGPGVKPEIVYEHRNVEKTLPGYQPNGGAGGWEPINGPLPIYPGMVAITMLDTDALCGVRNDL